jgi:hypothetical protein
MAFYSRFLERVETRLTLADWAWRAVLAAMTFGIPAWAAHATDWLLLYGPIAWIGAGLAGMLTASIITYVSTVAYQRLRTIRLLRKISERADAINPMDQYFHSKRINLQWFVPPSGDAVEGKTFTKCEILGPLNIIPFGCHIFNSLYVSTDYIMVRDEALTRNQIRNGHVFRNCTFQECKFYFVSFLVSESAFEVFNSTGGCNWITHTPVPELALTAPPTVIDLPP